MGQWMVIAAITTGFALPAAAQSVEQYQNRQVLQDSQRSVGRSTAGTGADTSRTVNQRTERLQMERQIQTNRSGPLTGSRPLR